MVQLGKVSLKDKTYLVEKRNKVLELATDLGFGEVTATRLTTAASEVIRKVAGIEEKCGLEFFIDQRKERFGLLIRFFSGNDISENSKILDGIFDEIDYYNLGNGLNALDAFKFIADYDFKPTEYFINYEQEKISRLTRDELYEELKKSYVKLKEEIKAHKKTEDELQKAKVEAERANEAKSEFLATMSHEIRTPMNAIVGMAELLSDTPLSKEQKGFVKTLEKAGDTLLSLINDILDLSKIEAGDVEFEKTNFDLGELIEGTCDVMAVRARKKNIEFLSRIEPNVPVNLIGDPSRLRQVLVNLIGNAIKFTDEGEIVLNVNLLHEEDPEYIEPKEENSVYLLFFVKDTGIGIPKDKQDKVFETFKQADSSTTRKYGGTGLGLSISKRITLLMGGKMWVESELGRGSKFCFTAPFGLQEKKGRETFVKPGEIDVEGMSTLIVDDNATNRLILREILSVWDAKITEAEGGKEAISIIKSAYSKNKPFDLVLLDYRMPEVDGIGVAKFLREQKNSDATTIIILSSDYKPNDLKQIDRYGIGAYLLKPVKRKELKNAILTTLGLWKAQIKKEKLEERKKTAVSIPHLKILLVEDNTDNRLLIEAFLKKFPVEIDAAENGQIAVDKFKDNKYDIVLMDMQMPVMDGFTATKTIRDWEKKNHRSETPILALTAYAMKEDRNKTMGVGCSDYLTKPVKKERLLDALRRLTVK
ncbi:response regulator [candidate division WOR-3 bacterium]|nr:response regulator [candidate division WOR-3 bacterium]